MMTTGSEENWQGLMKGQDARSCGSSNDSSRPRRSELCERVDLMMSLQYMFGAVVAKRSIDGSNWVESSAYIGANEI